MQRKTPLDDVSHDARKTNDLQIPRRPARVIVLAVCTDLIIWAPDEFSECLCVFLRCCLVLS